MSKISLQSKFALIDEHWRPKVVASLNEQEVKLAKICGSFPWHVHENEDEMFLVWKGSMIVEFRDRIKNISEINRSDMTVAIDHRRDTKLQVHNRLPTPTTVYVRHPITEGWSMVDLPEGTQRLVSSYLVPVKVPASGSADITLTDSTLQLRTLSVSDREALELLAQFASDESLEPSARNQLAQIGKTNDGIATLTDELQSLRDQGQTYAERSRDLHAQIVTLKLVKSAGDLLSSMNAKLKQTTELSQRTTIAIVQAQENLMLERVRLASQLSELGVLARGKQLASH